MTAPPTSPIGRALYDLLPTLYRARDNGDLRPLAHYLDACGSVLDAVRALLDQRLADGFIESREADTDIESCQPWLVPYIAQLLDVRLASSLLAAQRAEIANSVAWRQRKGTLGCALEIARLVGGVEVKLQEGWRRVATTPHVALPLVPQPGFEQLDRQSPLATARHPNLPAVTVDLREGPSSAPAHPGRSDDESKRTVDLRTPSWRVGHVHPKRLLVYASPPEYFFPADQQEVVWQGLEHSYEDLELSYDEGARRWTLRGPAGKPIKINGRVTLKGRADDVFRFEGIYFADALAVETGALELERAAACNVEVQADKTDAPILSARSTLLGEIQVPRGLARLEYCTVLRRTLCAQLQASDCVFGGPLQVQDDDPAQGPRRSCIRYSRIPPDHQPVPDTCRTAQPVFYSPALGQPGGGALHPATPASIRFGAEDGGEMGAYHHLAHCLNSEAVRDKLADFLPLGMETVVIPDQRDRYWRPYASASSFARVYMSGTHNGWGAQPMALVADHTWQVTATFGSGPRERFRFDVDGQGSAQGYGDNEPDGTADREGADIVIAQGPGDYVIRFHDDTRAYTVTKRCGGFRASYASVFFRGTPTGWDKTPMNLVADHTWATRVSFGSGPSERFRFDVAGDGSITYGENDTPSVDPNDPACAPCALGSRVTGTTAPDADIPVTEGAGSYLVTFDDRSKAYKVTKQ